MQPHYNTYEIRADSHLRRHVTSRNTNCLIHTLTGMKREAFVSSLTITKPYISKLSS